MLWANASWENYARTEMEIPCLAYAIPADAIMQVVNANPSTLLIDAGQGQTGRGVSAPNYTAI
jgi:hypothetical protein